MDEICEQFLSCTRFSLDQNSCLCVCHAEGQFHCAANDRGLSNDAFFSVAFMQCAAEAHHLSGKLIPFECGADLISNALDQRHLVVMKSFPCFTPNKSQQSKRLAAYANGGH